MEIENIGERDEEDQRQGDRREDNEGERKCSSVTKTHTLKEINDCEGAL